MLGLLFAIVGLILVYWGHALITNRHGATDWWLDCSQWARETFGKAAPIRYTRGRTRVLGRATMAVGFVFLVAGFGSLR